MLRRLTFPQMFLGTLLGLAGGVYIYKPIFEQHYWNKSSEKLKLTQEKEEKDNGV